MEVTKKEIKKSMEMKRILQNIFVYLAIYLLIALGFTFMLLYSNPTWGLIMLTITSFLFILFEGYQIYRIFHLLNGIKTMPCLKVKLDKVNYYLSGKIPVFVASFKGFGENEIIPSNASFSIFFRGYLVSPSLRLSLTNKTSVWLNPSQAIMPLT